MTVISSNYNLHPVSTAGPDGTALLNYVSPGDALKQVALEYNAANDTMYVGVQTWGVAGNIAGTTIASGNGMVVGFSALNGAYNPTDLSAPTFVAGAANVHPPGLEDPKVALAGALKIASQMTEALSSTSQDMMRGKRTEIDSLNGYISRRGAQLGVPTPVNHALFTLVKLAELQK